MKMISNSKIVFVVLLILTLLVACSSKETFNSQKSAQKYALCRMKSRYDLSFEISGQEKFDSYNLKDVYTCAMTLTNNKNMEISVRVTSDGELSDDYGTTYFENKAKEAALNVLKEKKYLKKYDVSFETTLKKERWDKDVSLKAYFAESKAFNKIAVVLKDDLASKKYAKEINDLLSSLAKTKIDFELNVLANEIVIYSEKLSSKTAIEVISQKNTNKIEVDIETALDAENLKFE